MPPDGGRFPVSCAVDTWRRQEATQQAERRDANESLDAGHVYMCECGDPYCSRTVDLSLEEYESVREWPKHFLIAANHENPEVESVVSELDGFAVIETLTGEASKVALRTNPRPLYPS
jgi:hypothetical protein